MKKHKIHEKRKVRSEAENHVFLDCLKPMPQDASRRELNKSVIRIENCGLSAELRLF